MNKQRFDAAVSGQTKYISEKSCKKCSTYERYTHTYQCVKCMKERAHNYRKTVSGKAFVAASVRKAMYGISKQEEEFIFEYQGKQCALCGTKKTKGKRSWHLDHCKTRARVVGKREAIRGILCVRCNVSIISGYEAVKKELVVFGPIYNELIERYLQYPPAQSALKEFARLNEEKKLKTGLSLDQD
jgi:recombination endonuclease VII